MDLYDVVVAKALSGGGGGGGSSDFTTATMTYSNSTNTPLGLPIVQDYGEGAQFSYPFAPPTGGTSVSVNVILYKGTAWGVLNVPPESVNISMSGAIEDNDGMFTITGDCTLTISA